MDLKKLLEWLKANNASEETIQFVEGLKTVNIDSVKDFLEKDEAGKKHLQSITDAAVTKGINTFKEKTMPGLIEEEIKKKFPDETPEQKKMRDLETNQQKLVAEIKRKDLLTKAINVATEKKLPLKIVDKFLGDDEEGTLKNLDLLESVYSEAVSAAVEAKFKENGRENPGGGGSNEKDYSKMTDDEYFNTKLAEQKK